MLHFNICHWNIWLRTPTYLVSLLSWFWTLYSVNFFFICLSKNIFRLRKILISLTTDFTSHVKVFSIENLWFQSCDPLSWIFKENNWFKYLITLKFHQIIASCGQSYKHSMIINYYAMYHCTIVNFPVITTVALSFTIVDHS